MHHGATKSEGIVRWGLDPRSLFPRCDFCCAKGLDHGTDVLGRWWAHQRCAADPANRALKSALLPSLNYARYRSRPTALGKRLAMLARINAWAARGRARLEKLARHRGDDLSIETELTEYTASREMLWPS